VTIVAAWMRAETGVGPSIASGSQVCNGNWPDLPQAPRSSSSPIAVAVPPCTPLLNTPTKLVVPSAVNITMIASERPTSPTRLAMKAFFPAVAASGLWNQKAMSRYDARPTPSQPT